MSMYEKLHAEAVSEIEEVGKMTLGSDDHVKTVQAVNGMADRLIKWKEVENESRKLDIEEKKNEIEEKKLESTKKQQFIDTAVKVGTTVLYVGGLALVLVLDNQLETGGFQRSSDMGQTTKRKLLSLTDKIKFQYV